MCRVRIGGDGDACNGIRAGSQRFHPDTSQHFLHRAGIFRSLVQQVAGIGVGGCDMQDTIRLAIAIAIYWHCHPTWIAHTTIKIVLKPVDLFSEVPWDMPFLQRRRLRTVVRCVS